MKLGQQALEALQAEYKGSGNYGFMDQVAAIQWWQERQVYQVRWN